MKDGLKAPLGLGVEAFVPAGNIAVTLGGGCLYKAQLSDCLLYTSPSATES